MTLIRNDMAYSEGNKINKAEAIQIKVTVDNQLISILNMYIPPNCVLPEALIRECVTISNSIILGDFIAHNIEWRSKANNKNGATLNRIIEEEGAILMNNKEYTYISEVARDSLLDLTICSPNLAIKANVKVLLNKFDSDHRPVVTTIEGCKTETTTKAPRWNMKKADWPNFNEMAA